MLRRAAFGLGIAVLVAAALLVAHLLAGPPSLSVPAPSVELAGLTVVNPGEGRLPDRTLRVRDGRIDAIEEGAAPGASAAFSGAFALPGLIDLHVHHPPAIALGERELFSLLFLRHGVTTVRDVGSFGGGLDRQRRRVQEGQLAGPRLYACGPILDGDPPGWPGARVVLSADEARSAIADLAEDGSDCIKIYNSISFDAYLALHEEAHRRGLPLVMHLPDGVPFGMLDAVELQHLMGLSVLPGDDGERALRSYAKWSKARRITHTPTLVAFARGAQLEDYERLLRDPAAQLLPRHYRELLWNPEVNPLVHWLEPEGFEVLRPRYETMLQTVAELHRRQIPVMAGTDTMNPFVVPGASLQEELSHLVAAGFSLEEAWQVATSGAGRLLAVPGLGTLRPGAPADILIFREDPTLDLEALSTLEAVVADGRLYPRAVLDEAIERQRRYFDGPVYSTLYRAVARLLIAAVHAWDGG
ncbi:MAG: amidohydrolase family protein [Myxococcota bacterium]